ncbi:MAG: SCO family protein [Candidatus Sedimenticola endophacoides]
MREIPASLLRLPAPLALAPFELLDQDGETFTNSYLNGRWSLLLSGRPPPWEATRDRLTLAARVRNRLAVDPGLQRRLQVLFVYLGPEEGRPPDLGEQIRFHGERFITLEGPRAPPPRSPPPPRDPFDRPPGAPPRHLPGSIGSGSDGTGDHPPGPLT